MIMDVLCGPLGGGLMGINKAYNPRNAPHEKIATAHFFFAINVASLTSVDQFKEEMDEQIRTTRKAEPRKGFDRVTLPGEVEWELTQERRANGIPLHKSQVESLETLADELDVLVPWK
jgi:LDH2 family malate/lactate/ureidoglycolate dehydrogenase